MSGEATLGALVCVLFGFVPIVVALGIGRLSLSARQREGAMKTRTLLSCGTCGETFDCRDLEAVYLHEHVAIAKFGFSSIDPECETPTAPTKLPPASDFREKSPDYKRLIDSVEARLDVQRACWRCGGSVFVAEDELGPPECAPCRSESEERYA